MHGHHHRRRHGHGHSSHGYRRALRRHTAEPPLSDAVKGLQGILNGALGEGATGEFGKNQDGVDGKYGEKTHTALNALVDKIGENNPALANKMFQIKNMLKSLDGEVGGRKMANAKLGDVLQGMAAAMGVKPEEALGKLQQLAEALPKETEAPAQERTAAPPVAGQPAAAPPPSNVAAPPPAARTQQPPEETAKTTPPPAAASQAAPPAEPAASIAAPPPSAPPAAAAPRAAEPPQAPVVPGKPAINIPAFTNVETTGPATGGFSRVPQGTFKQGTPPVSTP